MNSYSFIFDVETTGLFTRKRREKVDFRKLVNFDNCRIVSISWIIIDSNEKDTIIEKKNYYIKPDKFDVPQESTNIHGLTTDYLLTNGITIHTVFQELKNLFTDKYNFTNIVSHNIDFDINVIKSELYRYNYLTLLEKIHNTETFCTMLNSNKVINNGKWPKLREAYIYFYNKDIENAHQAEFDTFYCYEIYKKLIK